MAWWTPLLNLDKWANQRLFRGFDGETISSQCGYAVERSAAGQEKNGDPWRLLLAGFIEIQPWFGKGHCYRSLQKIKGEPDG